PNRNAERVSQDLRPERPLGRAPGEHRIADLNSCDFLDDSEVCARDIRGSFLDRTKAVDACGAGRGRYVEPDERWRSVHPVARPHHIREDSEHPVRARWE